MQLFFLVKLINTRTFKRTQNVCGMTDEQIRAQTRTHSFFVPVRRPNIQNYLACKKKD